jgi:4-hydroxy-tetrahydrodipicolinate reductase
MPIRIAINGAAGRMGQRLVAMTSAGGDFALAAALEHAGHPNLGDDAGQIAGVRPVGVKLSATLDVPVDVVVDFSVPKATAAVLATCLQKKIPLVVATTGLGADLEAKLREASRQIPILWSPSMSLAVNLAMKLSETAGRALADHPSGADVEIIEQLHRFNEDAPSGTALRFGEIIAAAMGLKDVSHGRSGRPGARPHGEIGYHAVRTGDNPGQHTIIFGLLGETLEISVRATSRDSYAHGALTATKFIKGKGPGLYSMNDVLGL